jgi:hypothetical protein
VKKRIKTNRKSPSAGSRIIASLNEAIAWVEGKDVAVRVTKVKALVTDKATALDPGGVR